MRQVPARSRGILSRRVYAFAAALIALASTGCRSGAPLITSLPPLAEEPETPPVQTTERPAQRNIALVMSDVAPVGRIQRPAVAGRLEGAKSGAAIGAMAPIMVASTIGAAGRSNSAEAGIFALGIFAAGLAVAPVGAGLGAGIGAVMAPTRDEADEGTARLERAFADVSVSKILVSEFRAAGDARGIRFTTAARGDSATATADTVLEIGPPRVSLTAKSAGELSPEWSPGFQLRVVVDVTLVRATGVDETRRWSWWWKHEGEVAAPFWDWSRNDARMFRSELERALRGLALAAVDELVPPQTQTSDR